MNIEISYGDHEPDLLSQSLTGCAPSRAPRRRFDVACPPARLAGKAASAATDRANRENRGRPERGATTLRGASSSFDRVMAT
jgi:hypothetical protein